MTDINTFDINNKFSDLMNYLSNNPRIKTYDITCKNYFFIHVDIDYSK
jgi:hypothetical protein